MQQSAKKLFVNDTLTFFAGKGRLWVSTEMYQTFNFIILMDVDNMNTSKTYSKDLGNSVIADIMDTYWHILSDRKIK